ncbi:hypothetical protein [Pengzhenrongella sicca]|uniref:Uncharacterized protein n=1 Tax=Pengzhenrongella sicca TaxID=2819238 RepID=A0A8A4ZGB5_9MICO|nr:hypothetical protein [Pengzhenrongella sicca]QTE30325.1 hypothetical protein J4E96_04815 [Pengzhenrongella sicca]
MIHITLGAERHVDPTQDALHRDRVGYSDQMSQLALYDANHGTWKLGERAQGEQYTLMSYGGFVRQAIEIESIDPVVGVPAGDKQEGRSIINGRVLTAGHPVYDMYVHKTSPVQGVRNPVTYVDGPVDQSPCRCGCGGMVAGREFLPGHDQTALHDRVRQIGTVAQFLDWFDVVRGTRPFA